MSCLQKDSPSGADQRGPCQHPKALLPLEIPEGETSYFCLSCCLGLPKDPCHGFSAHHHHHHPPRSMLCLPRCHRHVSPVASPCQRPLPTSLRAHHGGFASCPEQWTCTQRVPAADCLHLCSSVGKREGQRLGQEMETPYVKQKLCCPRAGVWGQSLWVTPNPSRCCCNNNNELLQTLSDFSRVSLHERSTNVA